MKKILFVVLFSATVSTQGPKTITTKVTTAEIFSRNTSCDTITLMLERKEETGKPTVTKLSYYILTCNGQTIQANPFTIVNEAYTIDQRGTFQRLELFSPIKISITWSLTSDWKSSFNGQWKTETSGVAETRTTVEEVKSARVQGSIDWFTIPTGLVGPTTVKTETYTPGK